MYLPCWQAPHICMAAHSWKLPTSGVKLPTSGEVTHLGGVDIRHDAKPTGGVDLEEEEGTRNARLAKAHISKGTYNQHKRIQGHLDPDRSSKTELPPSSIGHPCSAALRLGGAVLTHSMKLARLPRISGGLRGCCPRMTSPVVPFRLTCREGGGGGRYGSWEELPLWGL